MILLKIKNSDRIDQLDIFRLTVTAGHHTTPGFI